MLRFLKVRLEAITDDFNNGIKAAQKEAKEFEKTIRPSKDLLREMGTAATAAGLAVVGSMTAMAKAAANYGDELLDASKRTGASVQELARLKFAAEQSGASFADVSTGLRILARNLDDAATKTGAQRKAFQDLGVSITDSTGKLLPMNTVLLEVADRFAKMEDGAEKAALAQELFGRGGAALIPVLNEGSAGLRLMGDEAERLGLVISRDAAVAGDEFNDTLEGIKGATLGLANAIGSAVLPSLTSMAEKARDAIVAFKDFTREHEFLTKAIFGFGAALTGSGGILLGLTAVLTIVPKVVTAFKALNLAMAAMFIGPAGLAVAGTVIIVGLVAAFLKYRDATSEVTTRLNAMTAAMNDTRTAAERLTAIQDRLKDSNGKALIHIDEMNGALDQQRKELGMLTSEQQRSASIVGPWATGLDGLTVNLKAGTIAMKGAAQATQQSATEASKSLAKWNDLKEAQERLVESTMDVIEATNEARRELASADIARILDNVSTRARLAATGFDEWVASVEDGTAVVLRLARELQDNPFSFDRLVMGDQEVWRRNADNRTQVFGDALQKMNGLAVTHAEFTGKVLRKPADEMSKAFATALGNVTSGFANALTDSLFKAKNFGDALLGLASSTAKSLLNALLVGLLDPLTTQLASLGVKLSGVFGGLVGSGGSAAGSVAGSAGGAAGSVGGGVSGAAGAASGLSGALISAGGGVLGGLISGLMGARQEGTLNAVEFNTRAAEIHLRSMIDQILWPIRHDVLAIRESSHMSTTQLDAIFNALSGGGSTSSRVTSASMSSVAPAPTATIQLVNNFSPTLHIDGLPEDWQTIVREKVIPELSEAERLNFRGRLDELIRLLRSSGFVAATA